MFVRKENCSLSFLATRLRGVKFLPFHPSAKKKNKNIGRLLHPPCEYTFFSARQRTSVFPQGLPLGRFPQWFKGHAEHIAPARSKGLILRAHLYVSLHLLLLSSLLPVASWTVGDPIFTDNDAVQSVCIIQCHMKHFRLIQAATTRSSFLLHFVNENIFLLLI